MSKEMPNGLDKKTVKQMDDSQKLEAVVDYIASLGESIEGLKNQLEQDRSNRYECNEERREGCQKRWIDYCNPRFQKLENFKWQALGIVGGLAFLGTVAGPIVAAWVSSAG